MARKQARKRESSPQEAQDPPLILVIDDDEVSLALIGMLLRTDGFEVMEASSGEEALKLIAKLPSGLAPKAVLADLQMPGLCGRELALALHALLPRSILAAMSATPNEAEGYDGFTGKPLDVEKLRELLARIHKKNVKAKPATLHHVGADPEAVLDERIYSKLERMMPAEALADIYRVCLTDARNRASQMLSLAGQDGDDMKSVRNSAHTIKGGAGMLGAAMLARSAALLELGSYRKDDLPHLINKLLDSCDQTQSILVGKAKPC